MATAISKPTSHTPKMKRPPPPFSQPGVNGVKPQPPSSSPPTTNKRIPGSTSIGSSPNLINGVANMTNVTKGPLNRTRNLQSQKPGEQSSRMGGAAAKTASGKMDGRVSKRCPEPYVKTTAYILKKYAKCPPSLIIHLHPTHFRFEQQDGSFPYNSDMKLVIEHLRAGTIPHVMIEEFLRGGVRFYEGCLIVRVVDHKSASAQARKASPSKSNENNAPFSLHNYNEHITPSAFVPYPKQNQLTEVQSSKTTEASSDQNQGEKEDIKDASDSQEQGSGSATKSAEAKPRVFHTVLHPTNQVLVEEMTLLVTTPDPRAAKASAAGQLARTQSGTIAPQSPATTGNQAERGHPAKRQKTIVEPKDLHEVESRIIRSLAAPLYLQPVSSLEDAQSLIKFMEDPLYSNPPPSPKRRKRTVAELAADEALAAEEERFMLIMDERLQPSGSGGVGASKAAGVDDTAGVAPFEPRFSRFKTLETIRMQLEEKAKHEHDVKMKQEMVKRQQQDQERERRRAIEQRQAEEHAKEEARRQQIAAQQAQAQLAAQQNRHVMPQANGVNQGQQSSPVVRNQTPHSTSSPLVGNIMTTQAVPMNVTASQAGSPPRPPSSLQHPHPNMMSHPMAPSRSQQGPSRHGTPQMTQGTPAMSHATPIMRNVTPTQRMGHGSPNPSMGQTPVMNHAIPGNQQMNNGMALTQQQQMMIQQRNILAQQQQQQQQAHQQGGHMGSNQFTPQQLATMQAQQTLQSQHQQQILQAQKQQQQQGMNPQQNLANMQNVARQGQPGQPGQPNQQAYQSQLMRAQFAQMQMVKQQQGGQGQVAHGSPQQGQGMAVQGMNPQQQQGQGMTAQQQQQQQLMMAAAQANGGQMPAMQNNMAARYNRLYHQRLLHLRHEMSQRFMQQYGPPTQYPPQIAQQYGSGLEKSAKAWVQDLMRREREAAQQHRASQQAAAMQMQQQQQNMMNGMGN